MSKPNITMVAFHGPKKLNSALLKLVKGLREKLKDIMQGDYQLFHPYDDDQIHTTIIGMEVDVLNGTFFGHWFCTNSPQKQKIDIRRFIKILEHIAIRQPLYTIRFGGYKEDHCTCLGASAQGWECKTSDAEFHSCDRTPYDGSYYAYQGGPVMITGWPVKDDNHINVFPHWLFDFRLAAESAGFLDKYHKGDYPHWMDDDCFIKVGTFDKSIRPDRLEIAQEKMRNYFSEMEPVTVDITKKDISIVLYEDPCLKDIIHKITFEQALANPSEVKNLYERLL